ncbi:FtsB family cell division protein [Paracraurococcus lichenis]|uniref:Septum formation initiator family protein n=1 Tax=Paracraurococcus lichenis TaxID=3064888 RepID=A0ABT9DX38_9PROT|nr:septum formation initiator family protein [Paracraurococcus sp. LOR1-02]MDO9708463.1 septum formation initiator family protein [Paracraurococcus sp. LOR1-02]
MSFGRALKRRVRDAMLPVAFAALCGYFAWHSQHGDFGLEARDRKLADIAQARDALTKAEAERDAMERRVAGLRGDRIDRDQLDERARALLNLVGKDELVIPYEPGKRLY